MPALIHTGKPMKNSNILLMVVGIVAFGALMSIRDEFSGLVPRAVIAAAAFVILVAVLRNKVRKHKDS
jgi:hypothetical protein